MNNKKLVCTTFSQLATLIDAGLPLVKALTIIANHSTDESFKQTLFTIKDKVESGAMFSDALKNFPDHFDDKCVSLVRAGEYGGILDTVLNRLYCYLAWEIKFERKINKAIGLKTRSDLNWLKWRLVSKIDEVDFENLLLEMPGIGSVLMITEMIPFCRTLGTLIACGVPILEALEASSHTGNAAINVALQKVKEKVSEGGFVGNALEAMKIFPPIMPAMINVGESTGALDVMLSKLSEHFEEELDHYLDEALMTY